MVADVYNTTVNINGRNVFSSSYSLGNCCCGGMYGMMNSCFGFGYGGFGDSFGFGLGYGAGLALTPLLPTIFKGIAKGATAVGKAIGSLFHKKSKTKNTEKA